MKTLRLKPREERRLRAGHLWAYSNEIDPPEGFRQIEPGTLVRLEDNRGRPLGTGYVNPHTLLAVRLLTGKVDVSIDRDWFVRRLRAALTLRDTLYGKPYYRLVHGESDGLPGLIIDRFGDVLVLQIGTAGMERLKPVLLEALQDVLKPTGIVLRNDIPARELEGLSAEPEEIGTVPESVRIDEDGLAFDVAMRGGQKTGWFYDQRDNRNRMARYVRGRRVLDVFSYVGGWGLRALAFGASEALCVDSSQVALDAASNNAAINSLPLQTRRGDALDVMKALRAEGRQFDTVIVDPPALIKRRKDAEAGLEHYAALNRAALQLLGPEGFLISCSCSHHLEEEQLQRLLLRESRHTGRRLQILEQGAQSADHPIHPAIPETRYLKAFYCHVHVG